MIGENPAPIVSILSMNSGIIYTATFTFHERRQSDASESKK